MDTYLCSTRLKREDDTPAPEGRKAGREGERAFSLYSGPLNNTGVGARTLLTVKNPSII